MKLAKTSEEAFMELQRVGLRLREAVRAAGGLDVVSQMVNVSKRSLSRYIAGEAEMPALTAVAIASATGKSLMWLLQGSESAGSDIPVAAANDDSVGIPLLNIDASAGTGAHSDGERVISRLPFSRSLLRELGVKPESCHFIRAKGDSMEPTIKDGAVVLIDTSRSHERGDGIYALMYGDNVRLKRCSFGAFGQLTLLSDNPAYPAEEVDRAGREQIKIVGKVAWVGGVV